MHAQVTNVTVLRIVHAKPELFKKPLHVFIFLNNQFSTAFFAYAMRFVTADKTIETFLNNKSFLTY